MAVNFTVQDFPKYPLIRDVLVEWESSHHVYYGRSFSYPYEKGILIVRFARPAPRRSLALSGPGHHPLQWHGLRLGCASKPCGQV